MRGFFLTLAAMMFAVPISVHADVEIVFEEGSPNDYMTIRNKDLCELGPVSVTIDLSTSAGGLYFDTTASGAGVSEYQPFRIYTGGDRVRSVTNVSDGGTIVTLSLTHLGPAESVGFTIDLDDSGRSGPTTIEGGEILGATAALKFDLAGDDVPPTVARFGTDGRAVISASTCLS